MQDSQNRLQESNMMVVTTGFDNQNKEIKTIDKTIATFMHEVNEAEQANTVEDVISFINNMN